MTVPHGLRFHAPLDAEDGLPWLKTFPLNVVSSVADRPE